MNIQERLAVLIDDERDAFNKCLAGEQLRGLKPARRVAICSYLRRLGLVDANEWAPMRYTIDTLPDDAVGRVWRLTSPEGVEHGEAELYTVHDRGEYQSLEFRTVEGRQHVPHFVASPGWTFRLAPVRYYVTEHEPTIHAGQRYRVGPNMSGCHCTPLLSTDRREFAEAFVAVLNGTGGQTMVTELRKQASAAMESNR